MVVCIQLTHAVDAEAAESSATPIAPALKYGRRGSLSWLLT